MPAILRTVAGMSLYQVELGENLRGFASPCGLIIKSGGRQKSVCHPLRIWLFVCLFELYRGVRRIAHAMIAVHDDGRSIINAERAQLVEKGCELIERAFGVRLKIAQMLGQ